jgi:muramoyltetrapeptide carboxypeptidase LdcA involved in peptidoglycan recycling
VGTNFPIGHTDPMITLPLLSQIKINTKDSTFIVNT